MKRLVVCCDGTWGSQRNPTVSNIVKIAESVRLSTVSDPDKPVAQRIYYCAGPGTHGYLADKILGGAFGLGLDANLSDAYWQLALNWEEGDEIYIFGFSRGAYTARSLSGLIARIGLLKPHAMIQGKLPEGLRIYRQGRKPDPDGEDPQEWKNFRKEFSHYPVPVKFIGVFDTVGAMGVPAVTSWRYKFHDLRLSPMVHTARQALAIDERRRIFAPCLWEITDEAGVTQQRPDRVKQVWFEGCHTDVGGGIPDARLSDLTLDWMVREAEREGLEFDHDRLTEFRDHSDATATDHPVRPNNSLTVGYRILNMIGLLCHPGNQRFYADFWRRLHDPDDRKVALASTVRIHDGYRPPNLARWERELGKPLPVEDVAKQPAPPEPEAAVALVESTA